MKPLLRSLSPGPCRCYVVGAQGSGEVALVDPALDQVSSYLRILEHNRLRLTHVVDTHTHADHISGAAALVDRTGCAYVMHANAPAPCVTTRVKDGEELDLAGARVKAMHTPGHTRDGMCLLLEGNVLTGDTLFLDEGGAGRDDLPGGDPGEHYDSLQRILTLPESVIIHPAHDYRGRPPSDLGRQKRTNPHFRARSKDEFVSYLNGLCLGPAEWMKEVLKANHACSRDPNAAPIPTEGNACEVMGSAPSADVEGIDPAGLRRKLAGTAAPVLLDVREMHELAGEFGHLPGIVHIPLGDLEERVGELSDARERDIVIICKSGARAAAAAGLLAQSGFAKVEVLAGGMMRWAREGFPVAR